jgi:SNF2 family DNA or RNA helicase
MRQCALILIDAKPLTVIDALHLFSQFTSMLDLIKPELGERGISFTEIPGNTLGGRRRGRTCQADRGGCAVLAGVSDFFF